MIFYLLLPASASIYLYGSTVRTCFTPRIEQPLIMGIDPMGFKYRLGVT
ncbi:hypothetical protein ACIXQZ_04150 [Bacteroides fragilis]